jgi:hypothetical protein
VHLPGRLRLPSGRWYRRTARRPGGARHGMQDSALPTHAAGEDRGAATRDLAGYVSRHVAGRLASGGLIQDFECTEARGAGPAHGHRGLHGSRRACHVTGARPAGIEELSEAFDAYSRTWSGSSTAMAAMCWPSPAMPSLVCGPQATGARCPAPSCAPSRPALHRRAPGAAGGAPGDPQADRARRARGGRARPVADRPLPREEW